MKKIFASALCVLLLAGPPRAGAADLLTECIKEVLQERLEKTMGDFTDKDYWQDLLTNVAAGTPEVVVQQIIDDYDPKSAVKDVGMKMLERLVPEAASAIGILLVANDAVYAYTDYMLQFYKDVHYQYFVDEVLRPSKTTRELRANYNKFVDEFVNGGGSDRAVKYDQRDAEEKRFHETFLQAFRLMYKAEQAAEAKTNAKKLVAKKLKILRAQAKSDAEAAQANLMAAGLDVSPANVRRYVKDSAYAAEVAEAARKAGQKQKEAAKPAVTTAAAKPDAGGPVTPAKPDAGTKPKTDAKATTKVTVAVPAQPGGGPLGNSLKLLNAGKEEEGKTPPDFSAYSLALADAANKLVFGDLAASVFRDLAGNINAGALAAFNNCTGDNDPKDCRAAYKRFEADSAQVRSNLDDLGGKLRKDLEDMRGKMEAAPRPSAKLAELVKPLVEKKQRAYKGPGCGAMLSGAGLKQAADNIAACKAHVLFLGGLADEVEAKSKEFRDFAAAYDQKLAADYAAYADKLGANYNLAEYAGAGLDSSVMQKLSDESARAKQEADSPYGVIGGERAADLRRMAGDGARNAREAEAQLALNQAFVALAGPQAEEAKRQFTGQTKDGKPLNFEGGFDCAGYYVSSGLEKLFVDIFSGALTLLDPKTRAGTPQDYMPYKQGSIRTWDAVKYPFYMTVGEHESTLQTFSEKVAAVKEMELERRQQVLAQYAAKVNPEAAKLSDFTAEAAELKRLGEKAGEAAKSIGACTAGAQLTLLYYGAESTLSIKVLQQVLDTYSKQVEDIKAAEQNAIAVFRRYAAAPVLREKEPKDLSDARTTLSCTRWKCSRELHEAYQALSEAQDKLTSTAFQLSSPVSGLAVNGQAVPQRQSYSYDWSDAQLQGGEIKITGDLQPAALGQLASLKLSLDCRTFDIDLPAAAQFSYSFRPRTGQRYCFRVKPERADGKPAVTWPAQDDYFTVNYMAGNADEVKAFYDKFRAAYESRNAAQVMALVSENWTAGDGTELSDLEENLRNNFRLYDEIKYDLAGLTVSRGAKNWQACYDVAITSRIFKRNLKHEEKSRVCDEVGEEGGKLKLLKTGSGSYWYVK